MEYFSRVAAAWDAPEDGVASCCHPFHGGLLRCGFLGGGGRLDSRRHFDAVTLAVLEECDLEHVGERATLTRGSSLPGTPALGRQLDGRHLRLGLRAHHGALPRLQVLPLYCAW